MSCEHKFQAHKQTYVFINNTKIPSSLESLCFVCGHHEISSPVEAFYSDSVKRSESLIRDDRLAYKEFLNG